DRLEEAANAPVVAAVGRLRSPRGPRPPGPPFRYPVPVEFVERARQVGVVAELEHRVARVVGDGGPGLGVAHAMDDRAVAAGRLAEAAAMLARGERAELAVDEGDEFARQVVGVATDGR